MAVQRVQARGYRDHALASSGTRLIVHEGGMARRDARPCEPAVDVLTLSLPNPTLPFPQEEHPRATQEVEPRAPEPIEAPRGHLATLTRPSARSGERRRARRLRALLTIAVGIFASVSLGLGIATLRQGALRDAYESLTWESHVVAPGESISQILSTRDLPGIDRRLVVRWVEERNGLQGATIQPGQVLSVPA